MHKIFSQKTVITSVFFLLLILVGLATYRDFGITSDEPWLRELGIITMNYVGAVLGIPYLTTATPDPLPLLRNYSDGDHGALFEMISIIFEKALNLKDEREIFQFKHFLTFLVSVGGAAALYSMAQRRFSDWRIGLLAALILVLSPRFFAESFYNSKDIIFMALFAIAINTMISFLLSRTTRAAILHAIATAIAFDIRIAAVVFPVLTVAFMTIQALKEPSILRQAVKSSAVYLILIAIFIPLMWPWLWTDVLGNLGHAFVNMAHFQRLIVWVLYRGHYYVTNDLPWHYIPVYILITTPIAYLLFFSLGALKISIQIIRNKIRLWRNNDEMQDIIYLGTFFGPILVVILLKSVLYNGWRHLYFVYPSFIMIAVGGFVFLLQRKRQKILKFGAIIILLSNMVGTAYWMIRNHPLNNVYFNTIAGSNWVKNYQGDYWGLSTYLALQYVLANDTREQIKIKPLQCINIDVSMKLLTKQERDRIAIVRDDSLTDYMLLNYIFISPAQDALWYEIKDKHPVYHEIKVDGETVIAILKGAKSMLEQDTEGSAFSTCP